VPLPLAHALVGASIAAAIVSPDDPARMQKIALGGLLAITPDFDFFFVWILGWDREWHRGFTHSILLALATGAAAYFTFRFQRKARDLWTYSLAMMSHGLLDALFSVEAGGVEFLWPFTDSRYRFGLSRLLESDTTSWTQMARQSVLEAVIFLPIFAVALWLSRPRRP
jgi:membrane-bound metal-dependent hydrolase YbcI (DUF457 family)